MTAEVTIYTKSWCGYCRRAKTLLDRKGVPYHEIDIERDPAKREEMQRRAGRHTVPQIFIDGESIGGCDELYDLEGDGQLDGLLNA